MQHVPAFAALSVALEFLEAGHRPDIGSHAETFSQKLLCLKRWGKPEEIGHAVAFLASSRAAYITGQQISVSGGLGV